MADKTSNFESPVGRKTTFAFGLVLLIVGLPFLALGTFGVVKLFGEESSRSIAIVIVVATLVGAFCFWTGIKMIRGTRRDDGGLLAPFILRFGGVLFLFMPVILIMDVIEKGWKSIWMIVEFGFYLAVAGACFALANRRQIPVLSQESLDNDT